jgi:hypothetical protein
MSFKPRYMEYYWVAHNFVFRNQNKLFVYWRAGIDRKQEVNVNKCILFLK